MTRSGPRSSANGLVREVPSTVPPEPEQPGHLDRVERPRPVLQHPAPAVEVADGLVAVADVAGDDDRPDHRVQARDSRRHRSGSRLASGQCPTAGRPPGPGQATGSSSALAAASSSSKAESSPSTRLAVGRARGPSIPGDAEVPGEERPVVAGGPGLGRRAEARPQGLVPLVEGGDGHVVQRPEHVGHIGERGAVEEGPLLVRPRRVPVGHHPAMVRSGRSDRGGGRRGSAPSGRGRCETAVPSSSRRARRPPGGRDCAARRTTRRRRPSRRPRRCGGRTPCRRRGASGRSWSRANGPRRRSHRRPPRARPWTP